MVARSLPHSAARQAAPGREADALEALAAATGDLLARRSLDEVLAAVVRAAALAVGAELALARVATPGGDTLVTRAVEAGSQVLAAELEGSKLSVAEVPASERVYERGPDPTVPPPIRRAAALAGADSVHLFPVREREAPLATLELYRERGDLAPEEQALGRLAAAHVGLAVELSERLAGGQASHEDVHGALDVAGEALAAGSDEQELAEHVVRLSAEAAGAERCLLWRIEPEAPPAFLAAHGVEGELDDLEALGATVETAIQRRGESTERDAAAGPRQGEIVVPLGEPPAGALQLFFADPAAAHVPESLSGLAARAAVALRRTRRAELVALALRRSQTIVAVISQAIAHLSLPHTLQTAVDRISELTASAHVAIYLLEGERLTTAAARGLRGSHVALAERLLELALGPFRGRGYLFIADMRRDPRLSGLEDVLAEAGVRRALVVPLLVHEEVIGALAVYKQRPRQYRPGEEALLIALSSQLAVAVENARLHARAEERGLELKRTLDSERKVARQLQGLFEISHSFARSLSLDATLEAVAQTMVELFDLDAAAIRLPDERGDMLVPRAIAVANPALQAATATILSRPQPVADPLPRRILDEGEALLLGARDGGAESLDPILAPFLAKGSTVAVLPLATPTEAIGTVTLVCLNPDSPLDEETMATAMAVTAQAALAIDNARLSQQQKDFAETMQRSLLPSERPAVPGLDVGHVYRSSARVDVGGDVYDFISLDDGRLAVCLGDVAGKGIQAAADMAMAKFAFRALARNYPDPGEFLARVNDVVTEEIALGKFITMLYAVVDPRTGALVCASAGHPPLRLVDPGGSISALPSSGLALGVDSHQTYGEERRSLAPGSSIVLYTDGVIEARRDGELYGEGRLDAFLRENASLPAQTLAQALLDDCAGFSGGEVTDDCAIVCLRLAP